ncbi:MAG: HEAT repeat domain-containing protein, partial [Candidatus Hodarchaeota archaeon]
MELIKNNFQDLKNPEEINDFLIKLSKNPSIDDLKYLKYFIDNLDAPIFEKIKLNLIFLLGEIGKSSLLEDIYLSFLIETYYTSDRWIRSEIIQAIGKISVKTEIKDNAIKLIGYAVNDDYSPIKINALKVLLNLREFPLFVRRNVFQA